MTKRLIIDDLRDLPLDGAVTCRTVTEAIVMLKNNDYDEIWLDYDLGGKPYETNDDLTIMPFVDYLVIFALENKDAPKPKIFVHTQNPVGRERIWRALERYYELTNISLYTMWNGRHAL